MSRRSLALCGAVLVAALFAVWRFGYHGVDPRLIFWPPLDELAAPAELDEPAELDVSDAPLDDVLRDLAQKYHVKIEIDKQALANAGVRLNAPVTRHVKDIRLRSLLSLVLRELDLTFGVRDGTILVTTPEEWEGNLTNYVARVHTLERLLVGTHPVDEEELAQLVTSLIAPASWEDAGGIGTMRPIPGALLVSHLPEVQLEVAGVLDLLADALADPVDFTAVRVLPRMAGLREARLLAALAERSQIRCVELPLKDVVEALSERHGIPIQLDIKAMDGVGVSSDTPVSRDVAGISLRSLLRLMLKELELTYMIRNDVLCITTPEVADNALSTRLYPIGDILARPPAISADELMDVLTTTAAPTTWEEAGGAGAIEQTLGCLLVWQTQDVHETVEEILAVIRQALRPSAISGPLTAYDLPPRERYIAEVALRQPVSFSFRETPLKKAIDELKVKSGIEIQIDIKALDGVGVSSDTPVTLELDNISLGAALRLLLKNLDLTYMIKNEVLQITTPEVADNALATRFYRVESLVDGGRWPGGETAGMQTIVDVMAKTISPSTWEDVGGAGSIAVVGDLLLVSQTLDVHEQLADLLVGLDEFLHSRARLSPRTCGAADAAAMSRLWQALEKPVDMDFSDMPLVDVVRKLSSETGVPIIPDVKALDGVGVASNDKVTLSAKNVPLHLALDLLVANVTSAGKHEVIELTTREVADNALITRLYDVRDLASSRNLGAFVERVVAPDSWNDGGGAGSLAALPSLLVVTQVQSVHGQVERVLEVLRTRSPAKSSEMIHLVDGQEAPLLAALARPVTIEFNDVPLTEALESLARELGVPLVIGPSDQPTKDREGLPRASGKFDARPAWEVLEKLLADAGLSYFPVHGTLVVGPGDLAGHYPAIRFYRVDDLLAATEPPAAAPGPGGKAFTQWLAQRRKVGATEPAPLRSTGSPLCDAIARCVLVPEKNLKGFFHRGYPGYVGTTSFTSVLRPSGQGFALWGEWLAVSGSEAAHREVESFLARLRRVLTGDATSQVEERGQNSEVGFYDLRPLVKRFERTSERQWAKWLSPCVEPLRYAGVSNGLDYATSSYFSHRDHGMFRHFPWVLLRGVLIVRQTPEAQAQIQQRLAFLETSADEFPSPADLNDREGRRPAEELANLLAEETDPLRLAYALWLAISMESPRAEVVAAVVKRLAKFELARDARLHEELCRTVARFGPLAEDAVPALVTQLIRATQSEIERQATPVPAAAPTTADLEGFVSPVEITAVSSDLEHRLVRTLAALGPRGQLEVLRFVASVEKRLVEPLNALSLATRSANGKDHLPVVVPWLAEEAYDREVVLKIIDVLDPKCEVSRRILATWEKDADPEIQKRGTVLLEILNQHRPKDPTPTPNGMFGIGYMGFPNPVTPPSEP